MILSREWTEGAVSGQELFTRLADKEDNKDVCHIFKRTTMNYDNFIMPSRGTHRRKSTEK